MWPYFTLCTYRWLITSHRTNIPLCNKWSLVASSTGWDINRTSLWQSYRQTWNCCASIKIVGMTAGRSGWSPFSVKDDTTHRLNQLPWFQAESIDDNVTLGNPHLFVVSSRHPCKFQYRPIFTLGYSVFQNPEDFGMCAYMYMHSEIIIYNESRLPLMTFTSGRTGWG